MLLGIAVCNFTELANGAGIGAHLDRVVDALDDTVVHSAWVMDHFFQIPNFGPETDPMLESSTTISYVAGRSRTLEVGALVTAVSYRHPGPLIKAVTTLDVLSNGRAWLGIGAAWNEREAAGLGVPFPPLRERFVQLEETLAIAHQMWAGDRTPFSGRQYVLDDPLNEPGPVRDPHPPILIGGAGEQRTLKLVARYADACNLFELMGSATMAHKLDVLRKHCETIDRDPDEVVRTTYGTLDDGDEPVEERFGALADLGIDLAIVELPGISDSELARVREIAEAIAPLGRTVPQALRRTLRATN